MVSIISLDNIIKITNVENNAKEIKFKASEEAKNIISNAIKDGEILKFNEINRGNRESLSILNSAEIESDDNIKLINLNIFQDCENLRNLANQKKEHVISYIIERIVKI